LIGVCNEEREREREREIRERERSERQRDIAEELEADLGGKSPA
jgi:hypothetical protein